MMCVLAQSLETTGDLTEDPAVPAAEDSADIPEDPAGGEAPCLS
ncbi:hypothetical protein [Sphaerisporangium album]|nr:hypothetical protein [Sphaerisporangium album]